MNRLTRLCKTGTKLRQWINHLEHDQPTLRTILQGVGIGIWASRVLAVPLAGGYYLFKFIRRRVAAGRQLDAPAHPWTFLIFEGNLRLHQAAVA
jgi:hypothetical protein